MRKRRGRLFVFSAPSGSGKTTILEKLQRLEPTTIRSISATTRPPRPGERNGRDYQFVNRSQFLRAKKRGEFLESARILGNWYGTPRRPIERALRRGRDVLLGVDIQGAAQIRKSNVPVTTVFVLPPSLRVLQKRLASRGTETPAQIRARLALARRELKALQEYDYAVVNDHLAEALARVRAVLVAERCRVKA